MTNLVSLDKNTHRDLRVISNKVDAESAQANLVPMSLSECVKAATTLPIVFAKNVQTGAFSLIAMAGFESGENLFYRNHKWDGHYVPLNVRRQPFFAGQDESTSEPILCINQDSPALSTSQGERLFDEAGFETDFLKSSYQLVRHLVDDLPATHGFVEKMAELRLIVPMNLDIRFDNGEQATVRGLYTIDEEMVSRLADDQLASLHQAKYLPAVYAMLVSLGHIPALIARRNEMNAELADVALS